MFAHYFTIESKQRSTGALGQPSDFTLAPAETVDAAIILSDPNLSLYCFDDEARQAIFVELPPDVDLSTVGFVYQTQYDQARRVLAISYEDFHALARQLPPVEHLIMIYISGRSGSTLLSNVFNQLDSVMSLSEPDAGTQLHHLRRPDGSRDAELRELLASMMRILFRPTPFKPRPTTCVLKLRSEALQIIDLFQAEFPAATNLYSYRDCIGFVRSFYRIFTRDGFAKPTPVDRFFASYSRLLETDVHHLRACLDPGISEITVVQRLALWWLANTEVYLAKAAQGFPFLAVRYADLTASREQVLNAIFAYCGLPTDRVAETLVAFERDSQAGTFLARDNPAEGNPLQLTDAQIEEINQLLQRHPVIRMADFIVPNTLII
ncbi:MAG TPA: sulfotransferase [Phototrophicaceae bacterium]|nr:sulfotransferase [Phototrophicaceae bacterium]